MRKDVEKLLAHFDVPGDKKPAPVPVFTIQRGYVKRGKRQVVEPQVVKMLVIGMTRNKRSQKVTVSIVSKDQYDKLGRFGGYGREYDLDVFAMPPDRGGYVFRATEAQAVVDNLNDEWSEKAFKAELEKQLAQEKLMKVLSERMPKLKRQVARAGAKLTVKRRAAAAREVKKRVKGMSKTIRSNYGSELVTTALGN